MPVVPSPVAVDDSPAVTVLAANGNRLSYNLFNSGPNTVYVSGSPTVTDLNGADPGFPIPINGSMGVTGDCDALYAICASAETASVNLFEVTRVANA